MEFVGTMENRDGRLFVGGCDVADTAKAVGTPLIIYDQAGIETRARMFRESFRSKHFKTNIIYASKALSILYLLGLIDELDLHLDVVSGGELHVAKQANYPMEKVYFHGNNKSLAELRMALELGVGTLVVDHPGELELLMSLLDERHGEASGRDHVALASEGECEDNRLSSSPSPNSSPRPSPSPSPKPGKQRVLLRVNPGIEAKTHKYIQTTTEESKFGMGTQDPTTHQMIRTMIEAPGIDFAGFHCHIGSQILDEGFFYEEARAILEFVRCVESDHECRVREVNLGGGFGVRYNADDVSLDYRSFLRNYVKLVEDLQAELVLELETVSIEPGRSLVNPFGSTIYEVGGIKSLPSGLNYVFVDGGMTDNLRPALYEAQYEAMVLNVGEGEGEGEGSGEGAVEGVGEAEDVNDSVDESESIRGPKSQTYRIAGKCCETGDVLIQEQELEQVRVGDLLLVHGTGAYTYSMSSNYNHLPRPAVVFLKDGEARLAVRRETYEDMLLRDEPYNKH